MNEEIKKVKRVIKNINKICDENNKSLQEVFKDMQVNEVVFLENIGIEKELFDDEVCQDLRTLLSNKDTRFYINNNMESIENDEIELYSKVLNKDLGFLKNKINAYAVYTIDFGKFTFEFCGAIGAVEVFKSESFVHNKLSL